MPCEDVLESFSDVNARLRLDLFDGPIHRVANYCHSGFCLSRMYRVIEIEWDGIDWIELTGLENGREEMSS